MSSNGLKQFIPAKKMSKKARKELSAVRRRVWGINPVTRQAANPRAYNRAAEKQKTFHGND